MSRDRALEPEGTYARRTVDPTETHWQGPQEVAAAASLFTEAAAGQGDSSQDLSTRARGNLVARRALWLPGKTHLARASETARLQLAVHKAAAGQRDCQARLESGQSR